jgi:hypothetical protein
MRANRLARHSVVGEAPVDPMLVCSICLAERGMVHVDNPSILSASSTFLMRSRLN